VGTTVVKRGAGRATHQQKTSKAAQRTPLPPCNQSVPRSAVEVAKEMVAEKKAKVSKAERLARSRAAKVEGPLPPAGGGRRDLQADAKLYGPRVTELRSQGMSWLHIAQAVGREGNLKTISVWSDRVHHIYTGGAPDPKPTTKGTRTPAEVRQPSASLPWVRGEVEDQEIVAKVTRRTVVWRNGTSGAIEECYVSPSKPIMVRRDGQVVESGRFTTGPRIERNRSERRVLTFASPTGFRSCYVDAILEVR
jgi:hypothetical protein